MRVARPRLHRRYRARRTSHQSVVVRRGGRLPAAHQAVRRVVHGAVLRPVRPQQHHDAARHARLPALQGAPAEQQVRLLDPAPGRAHPHRGPVHVHRGRTVPGVPRRGHGHLDPAGEVRPGARCRRLRVSGRHRAQDEPLRPAQCRRAKDRDSGRVGPVREGRQHGLPQVCDHAGAGGARLHLLVPQRRPRPQLRPHPRRDTHGAHRPGHHGGEPDHLQSAARGLRQLLVRPLQPGLRLGRAARPQRRAAGGDAARERRAGVVGAGVAGPDGDGRGAGGGAGPLPRAPGAAGGGRRAAARDHVPRRGRRRRGPIASQRAPRRPRRRPPARALEPRPSLVVKRFQANIISRRGRYLVRVVIWTCAWVARGARGSRVGCTWAARGARYVLAECRV